MHLKLLGTQVIMNFNVKCKTRLYVDHGDTGISSTVAQEYKDKQGNIVYCPVHHNSHVLTKTERHYGEVEGKSLMVTDQISYTTLQLNNSAFTSQSRLTQK